MLRRGSAVATHVLSARDVGRVADDGNVGVARDGVDDSNNDDDDDNNNDNNDNNDNDNDSSVGCLAVRVAAVSRGAAAADDGRARRTGVAAKDVVERVDVAAQGERRERAAAGGIDGDNDRRADAGAGAGCAP